MPAGQEAHPLDATAEHVTHAVDPGRLEAVPAGQSMHTVGKDAFENVPAAHVLHWVEPLAGEKLPAVHDAQAVAPRVCPAALCTSESRSSSLLLLCMQYACRYPSEDINRI